jgi:predicted ATPase
MADRKPQARITRVRLENYKSIKFCDVQLEPITVLVGQNGSGKSNFLDGVFFVAEALTSFSAALSNRGEFREIVNKQHFITSKKPYFRISLSYFGSDGDILEYILKVSLQSKRSDEILTKEILKKNGKTVYSSENESSQIESIIDVNSQELTFKESLIDSQNNFSNFKNFLYSMRLSDMISPVPEFMRNLSPPTIDLFMMRGGSNLASMLLKIQSYDSTIISKISYYLNLINPNFTRIEVERIKDSYVFVKFFDKQGQSLLNLLNVSSGTARALAILTTILASKYSRKDINRVEGICPILGFEEPELGLHPSAATVILDAMRSESNSKQFIITTHSPDLLEYTDLESKRETVLAVEFRDNETIIAPIDAASREIVRRNLYTLGDLLRMNQLEPEVNPPKPEGSV